MSDLPTSDARLPAAAADMAGPGARADAQVEGLLVDVQRLADRLRHLGETRLRRLAPNALGLAQQLADQAATVEGRGRRTVRDIGPFCVGDQVAVTGMDLVAALVRHGDTPTGTLTAARAAVRAARAQL